MRQVVYKKTAQSVGGSVYQQRLRVDNPVAEPWISISTNPEKGVVAGARAATVATVASAVPTLACVCYHGQEEISTPAQALIVSIVAGSAYFVVADKTVLATARKNSLKHVKS